MPAGNYSIEEDTIMILQEERCRKLLRAGVALVIEIIGTLLYGETSHYYGVIVNTETPGAPPPINR